MGSQRTRGTPSKAHRHSTCLAAAMAGRRTPSGRPGSALLRGKRRPAAARRDGRAASLPARLPRCLSPTADGDRSPEPGPGGVSHAPHGSTDNSSPPLSAALSAAALRRLLPPALRCAALRWARPLPARSRSAPPWPGAPPCGLRRDCSGTGRAPGRRLSLSQTPVFERSFHFTFTGKRVLRGRDAAYDCSAKQRELFQMFSAIPPLFQKHVLPVVTVLLQGNR